jgi:hypothetical protein
MLRRLYVAKTKNNSIFIPSNNLMEIKKKILNKNSTDKSFLEIKEKIKTHQIIKFPIIS